MQFYLHPILLQFIYIYLFYNNFNNKKVCLLEPLCLFSFAHYILLLQYIFMYVYKSFTF